MNQVSSRIDIDEAIRRLVEEHLVQIEVAAKRVLGQDHTQAMDELRQEVRVAIWRVLETGETVQRWEAFIYCCAYRRAVNLLKQTRRRARHEVSLDELISKHGGMGEEKLNRAGMRTGGFNHALLLLNEELHQLPEPIRLTVLLRKGEGYSRADVAQMLHCSQATVDYRLRQGIDHLKKRFEQCGFHRSER
jgi:RNA polymerase sigma factor (sigma-70 family)